MTTATMLRQIAESAQANASAAYQAMQAAKINGADSETLDLLIGDYNLARSIEEAAFAKLEAAS